MGRSMTGARARAHKLPQLVRGVHSCTQVLESAHTRSSARSVSYVMLYTIFEISSLVGPSSGNSE